MWYELLAGEWPFKTLSPEAIIWQIGKGMKQSLSHIQASRDVKVGARKTVRSKVMWRPKWIVDELVVPLVDRSRTSTVQC